MADDLTTPKTVPNAVVRGWQAVRAAQGAAAEDDLAAGESYPISDTLADLRHLADARGLDWEELLYGAVTHYDAERGDA